MIVFDKPYATYKVKRYCATDRSWLRKRMGTLVHQLNIHPWFINRIDREAAARTAQKG